VPERLCELYGCLLTEMTVCFYRLFPWLLPDINPWSD
jgi:hypothetical protein